MTIKNSPAIGSLSTVSSNIRAKNIGVEIPDIESLGRNNVHQPLCTDAAWVEQVKSVRENGKPGAQGFLNTPEHGYASGCGPDWKGRRARRVARYRLESSLVFPTICCPGRRLGAPGRRNRVTALAKFQFVVDGQRIAVRLLHCLFLLGTQTTLENLGN
jgi:hypothetical protein